MLNNIIQQLEEAKKCQIPHIEAGIEMAISIIKQHESEFEQEIKKAFNDGANIGTTPEDYYNQNYKNE